MKSKLLEPLSPENRRVNTKTKVVKSKLPMVNFSGLTSTPIIFEAPLARAPSATCPKFNINSGSYQYFYKFVLVHILGIDEDQRR